MVQYKTVTKTRSGTRHSFACCGYRAPTTKRRGNVILDCKLEGNSTPLDR